MKGNESIADRDGQGFTLVEVALALMVVSIGLLTVFSLFPAGLQLQKNAVDDTQAAMFGEMTLDGVRGELVINPDAWSNIAGEVSVPMVAPTRWVNQNSSIQFTGPTWREIAFSKSASDNEYKYSYKLELISIDDFRKGISLTVRPSISSTNQRSFYTEVYNVGMISP